MRKLKKEYWLLAASVATALLLLAVFARRQDNRIEEDGGTRHRVDTNAPKVIGSTEITYFRCEFSTRDRMIEDCAIAGLVITLEASADGASYSLDRGSETDAQGSFRPDEAFFRKLQQVVSRYDLAQYNGQFCTVSGLPPGFGIKLEIRYASGETIEASDNQSCFLPVEAMEELVALFQEEK